MNCCTILATAEPDWIFRRLENSNLIDASTYRDLLYHQSPLAIAVTDLDGKYLDCNPSFERFIGYTAGELREMTFRDIIHPADLVNTVAAVRELLSGTKDVWQFQKRYRKKDGNIVWGELLLRLVRDSDGEPLALMPFIMDITQQKRAESELALAAEILAKSNALTIAADEDGGIVYVSPSVKAILGYDPEELIGEGWWSATVLPSDDIAEIKGRICAAARREAPLNRGPYERNLRTKAGDVRRISWTDSYGPNGYVIGIGQDVTERREAEAVLQAIFDHSQDAIVVLDDRKQCVLANRAATEVFGCRPEQLFGQPIPESHDAEWQRLMSEGSIVGQTGYASSSTERVLQYSAVANFLPGRHLALLRDITDIQRMEQQLASAAKFEAIGQLAGGVAHDFNNLLMVIGTYGQLLQDALAPQDQRRRYTQQILKASERGSSLTGQLLAFSRRQVLRPQIVDVMALVQESSSMLCRLMGEDIELVIKREPDGELLSASLDPGQFVQVLLNLCANARDAMPGGGRVTIETGRVVLDETYVRTHTGVEPGDYLLLTISDNGGGMTAEVKARIFEPFFTTKAVGKGTGLGLPMVYGIVKQSGGYIWVYSEIGIGTTFKIYLPFVGRAVASEKRVIESPKCGDETILLVEDEAMLRASIAEYLGSRGYFVVGAQDGVAALTALRRHAKPVHLVLTDVVMPHMGGRELVESVLIDHPEIKVVFMSGYTSDKVVQLGLGGSGSRFLQKPFSLLDMERAVRSALDERVIRRGIAEVN